MTVAVTRLANGLTVATDSMPEVESVSLGVYVACGTRHEAAAVNGVAHMLEHMAFKGTERRSALRIAEEIEAVGGHLNAYTSREQTAYYARVLADDLGLGLDIMADILQHSTFEAGELERERQVILQEIGQAEDTPDDIIFDRFQAAAFPDQAVGRPVLGTSQIVASLSREAVGGYMRAHYGPDAMILAAAGRVAHDHVVELARCAFTDLPKVRREQPEPARYRAGEAREDRDLEQLHVVLGFEGIGYHDPDYFAQAVFSTLFGGGMSSRLFQEVREKRGLVYSIYSFASAMTDSGIFGVYAGTGEKEIGELLPVVAEQFRNVAASVSEAELARARAQHKAGLLMARESTSARAEQLAHQLMIYGRPLDVPELVAKVDAVDPAAIARVVDRLSRSRLTVAAVGPLSRLEPYPAILERFA
ncbi:MAG: insulinase family protein [Proteobacteria bacterium]|nr:insulinase family protein [Pseudomonadota bacterium]